MNISHDGPSLGPPNLPTLPNYPPYHPGHLVDASASNSNSTSPNESTRRPRVVPGDHGHGYANAIRGSPIKRSGSVSDDGNRSRNAKAQRRHREKRKAQLKLLEHRVVELETQCESLTHKLGQCVSEGRGPVPALQELEALQGENAYLRQENQELRRQLAGGRTSFPSNGMPPPPTADGSKSGDGSTRYSGEYPSQLGSPRGYDRVNVEYGHEVGPPNSAGFQHMDQMTPMSRHSRTRASISSGVTPSPYIPSSGSFPTDPRHHALDGRYSSSSTSGGSGGTGNPTSSGGFDHQNQNQPQPPNQHQSYSHGPPPHTMPRNGMMYPTDDGFPRDTESWAGGPPPFTSQVSYAHAIYPGTPGANSHHDYPGHGQSGHQEYPESHVQG